MTVRRATDSYSCPAHRELQPGVKAVQVVLRYEQPWPRLPRRRCPDLPILSPRGDPPPPVSCVLCFPQLYCVIQTMSYCLSRICYSDTSCPQEDQYPPNIAVKVNHSYCSVPVSERGTWGRAGERHR